ncbi:hypothetical protein Gasu2_27950 [Galdieria sulphuraria]|uniref:Centromere/kinetochore protein zw10 n=1 Tax=Galdieria sulphuraria TaxID=130081 RepID=M2XEX3_GALSU|nr:centromere/kinetochore protein zw10 [Galdieria sulphuraria]EME28542.1 centromere/kinetochore protein zw10 [Galdieria sulphuraria]GJD08498.1 hypothetical protein Gasu2_27950 [Galdieria sulphuraria]|eukprot:XP_005705062.1 centromere/kinetochore protein zw10 [Galdieria sulphuraria]
MQYSVEDLERNLKNTSKTCGELEERLVNFCKNQSGIRTLKREAGHIFPQIESLLQQSQFLDERISQVEHQVEQVKSSVAKHKVQKEDLLQLYSLLEKLDVVSQGVGVSEELSNRQKVPGSMDLETLSSYERQIQQGLRSLHFIYSFGISNSCLAASQTLMEKEHVRLRSEMVGRLTSCFHWYDWGLSIDKEAKWISTIIAQGKYMDMAVQEIVSLLKRLGVAGYLQRASKVEIREREFLFHMQDKNEDVSQVLEWEDCSVQELDILENCLDLANGCKRALVIFDFILSQTFDIDYYREVAVGFYDWFQREVCSSKCILGHFKYLNDLDGFSDPSQFSLRLRGLTICAQKLRIALQARGMDISLAESLVPDIYRAEEDLAVLCHRHVLVYSRNILKSIAFCHDELVDVSSFLAASEHRYLRGKLVDAGELCPFPYPICKVTKQGIELSQAADRIFQDAYVCLQNNLSLLGSTLMKSISEMLLSYYRIVSANCYNILKSQLLAQAIYHNDCFLLAHICCIIEMRKTLLISHLDEEAASHLKGQDYMIACFRLRCEGSTFLAKSISATKDAIYACVSKASEGVSFEVCYQTSIFNRIQRSLDAASLSFETLLFSWKDYLPKSVLRNIGLGLLENYCQWLIQAVFALEDIPLRTSSCLASLLQEETEKKTKLVAQVLDWEQAVLSERCRGVSSLWWICKILNSNLEEIVKMVQHGPLKRRIAKDQLIKLVTALFEKTAYRKKCLQQIAIAYSVSAKKESHV